MKKYLCLSLLPLGAVQVDAARAKNIILFLGDAGGVSTLNAASIYGHDRPQSLYIQQMKHVALSDTASLNRWVTDSAAGMTAIVTGRKTNQNMVSVLPAPEPGADLPKLKTILEYAEERGLSTGVVTNMAIWDATPAACYAHAFTRKMTGEIFQHLLKPRFGDGPEVVIGTDWKGVVEASAKLGFDAAEGLAAAKYHYYERPDAIPADATRVASIFDGGDYDPKPVLDNVLQILSRNRK
ncbi:MAG TPA: alkaline phosphatase, partial [Lacunisphaera sp.]|nr:alkaline phosphatase [Lacunisphaera sp.]